MIRWLKFNLVGGIGIGVQLAVLAALKSGLHLNYPLAITLAVEAAVIHNFFWHETLYLERSRKNNFVVYSIGEVQSKQRPSFHLGNLLLMRVFAGLFHLNYLAANFNRDHLCSLANFLVSDRFVFQIVASKLNHRPRVPRPSPQ